MNVLLISGGGGSEHEIAVKSGQNLHDNLVQIPNIAVFQLFMQADGRFLDAHGEAYFLHQSTIQAVKQPSTAQAIDYVLPYMHGYPSETGDIQSLLEIQGFRYLGCAPEINALCFNKVSTKAFLEHIGVPVVPYLALMHPDQAIEASWQNIQPCYVKAASQGSSIGCYKVEDTNELAEKVKEAFRYSNQVLIEPEIQGRELEIAAYIYNNELIVTNPSEIVADGGFYSYDAKYKVASENAITLATGLSDEQIKTMQAMVRKIFAYLRMDDMARFDFLS